MLKHVEQVRERIVRGQQAELSKLRIFLSMTEGNQQAVDRLCGDAFNRVLARVTEVVMEELGHETEVKADSKEARSRARRVVARLAGAPVDE